MAADPWTTLAKVYDADARAARARALDDVTRTPGRVDEAERLEACAERQRELAVMHGFGSTRWFSSRPEPVARA